MTLTMTNSVDSGDSISINFGIYYEIDPACTGMSGQYFFEPKVETNNLDTIKIDTTGYPDN